MASTGLLAPTALGFRNRRQGSTLGQRSYVPSCRTTGFLTPANFEEKLANLPAANVPGAPVEGEDTGIVAPAASGCGCRQRTNMRGTRNPSWGGWSAYTASLRSWRSDHFSCWGWDPAYPFFEQFSSWPDRCRATRWAVYLGSLRDNELSTHWIGSQKSVTGRDWMKRKLSWYSSRHLWRFSIHTATVEVPWGTIPASWRAASAYGTWLWWPCPLRRGPTRRGVRVWACHWYTDGEVQGDETSLRHPSPHATTRRRGCLEGRFKRLTPMEWDGVD